LFFSSRAADRALHGSLFATIAAALFAATGCRSAGAYTWASDLPFPEAACPSQDEYVLRPGDTVNIRVYEQEGLSMRGKVRSDGRIAVPLLGDVEIRGKRPSQLAAELETRFKAFIVSPKVIVNLDEVQPISVSVVGEVARPGTFPLESNAGVLQALAGAGGLTDYASDDRIFVVRRGPPARRIRMSYRSLTQNDGRAGAFCLRAGDVVVAE
jgi:polysaccharide biosynthesis/export protein